MLIYKRFFKPYLKLFWIAIVFLAIESMADLFQPLLISKLIDVGIKSGSFETIKFYGALMIIVALIGLASALMRNYLSTKVSFGFAQDLRQGLYQEILAMDLLEVESIERGSLINRLTFDVNQLRLFANGMMRIFLKAPMLAIGSFFMVLRLDKRLVIIYLLVLPVVTLALLFNLKVGYPRFAKIQVKLDALNKRTIEYLNGIRVVKAFNKTQFERKQFNAISQALSLATSKAMKVMAIFNPIVMLTINMGIIAVLLHSEALVLDGEIGVGQVVAFTNYMTQLLFAVSIIARVFNTFLKAKTSSERVEAVFTASSHDSQTPHEKETNEPDSTWQVEVNEANDNKLAIANQDYQSDSSIGQIKFEGVSFRYGQGEETLSHLDLTIESGEHLGIVGATGAGKTTLIMLLLGYLKPCEGHIYFGNLPLTAHNKGQIRQTIGYVPQDKILFSQSILDNLRFGCDSLSPEAYEDILRASEADFVFKMPNGMNTLLGKGGVNISGGQKQRLSIARALTKSPSILVLDDSTSALDAITEKAIIKTLTSNAGQTLIVVGQKISTVMHLDRIIVLEGGKIVASGSHKELLRTSSHYQDLAKAQLGGDL